MAEMQFSDFVETLESVFGFEVGTETTIDEICRRGFEEHEVVDTLCSFEGVENVEGARSFITDRKTVWEIYNFIF